MVFEFLSNENVGLFVDASKWPMIGQMIKQEAIEKKEKKQ